MSATLLRIGLWMVVVVLAMFVVRETFTSSPLSEMVSMPMLQQALVLSVLLVIAGLVAKMFEKTKKIVAKNRCRVCGKAVPQGAIYCREHLRNVLDIEDRRTHSSRLR